MIEEEKEENNEKILFSWRAPEFPKLERKPSWYITGGLILLVLIALLVIWKQWLLLLVIVLLAIVTLQYSLLKPREIEIKITNRGLHVGGKFHSFSRFKSFWISSNENTVSLVRKKWLTLSLVLPLPQNQLDKVRKILIEFLPEEVEQKETPIDQLSRILKF